MSRYEIVTLTDDEVERLERIYSDLMELGTCKVPSVRASARSAVAHIAQALNGQGLAYELYTGKWDEE